MEKYMGKPLKTIEKPSNNFNNHGNPVNSIENPLKTDGNVHIPGPMKSERRVLELSPRLQDAVVVVRLRRVDLLDGPPAQEAFQGRGEEIILSIDINEMYGHIIIYVYIQK